MKHLIFLFILLLLQSCGTLWRGLIHQGPNVGDSHIFPLHEYQSDTIASLPLQQAHLLSEDEYKETKTDILLKYSNDTITLFHGDEKTLYKPHEIFSITKSIVSLLVGIAIDEGRIKSVDDNIDEYINNLDNSFAKTTIKELLQMRSGVNNSFALTTILYYGTNLKWGIRQTKIKPDEVGYFEYSDLSTQLLAFIVQKATNKPIQEYFYEKLWLPLEMQGYGYWSLDSKRSHTARAFCGLSLSPINLLKIGELVIHNGTYNDKNIISKDWINSLSNIAHPSPPSVNGYDYNYHWRSLDTNHLYAKGLFGQYLYVDKTTKTIYLRLGRSIGDIDWIKLFRTNTLVQMER